MACPMGRAAGRERIGHLHGRGVRPSTTEDEIRSTVITWHNRETDKDILSGFTYENVPVWLSSENQFNYKAASRPCRANSRGDSSGRVLQIQTAPNRSIASLLHWKT